METNIDFRYRNYIIILSVSLDTDLGPLGRDPKKQIPVCNRPESSLEIK